MTTNNYFQVIEIFEKGGLLLQQTTFAVLLAHSAEKIPYKTRAKPLPEGL